jgi:ABC-2 type transport system permease protein
MIVLLIAIPLTNLAGVEQSIFKYNQGPGYSYSDMDGYGSSIDRYFVYKLYWVCLGVIFYILTLLFYNRGVVSRFKERFTIAKQRFNGWQPFFISLFTILFLSIGGYIYYINNVLNVRKSSKEREISSVEWEKKYKKFEKYAQPRIVAVNVNVDLFPKTRDFEASGHYIMVNKSDGVIDSVFLDHSSRISTFEFNKPNSLVLEDTVYHFDIYHFKDPILPGDSLKLAFTVKNKQNTLLRNNSPILYNGTFINNSVFPSLGYPGGGLTDDKTREKYGLPPNKLKPHPLDSTALGNTYISNDADWVDFEAVVSTTMDQIAIAPGYLQKDWIKEDRRYFHYKMDSKILNFYAFNSAEYQVKKDKWGDVDLEIYYHKGHEYNLDRMMKGMKYALEYCSTQFSPYQHKQLRIVEFPRVLGSFAQSFPNTVPFSEGAGFIADVDDSSEGGNDYPFYITAHEVAHQWFAHQVIGADVLGATVMSESLSEYVGLKIIESVNGKTKMRKFLKKALDNYLTSRTFETKRENALMYNDGQGYIHYQKGSLVFYALSDYLGEEKLNNTISEYVKNVAFQDPPYTTTIELLDFLKQDTPDSLKYVLNDMLETITLYDNKAISAVSTKLENGKFQVDFEFNVSKYRNDDKGKMNYGNRKIDSIFYKNDDMEKPSYSVFLEDYIDIGIFGTGNDEESELYLKKHKISAINNTISLIVDKKPVEVGIDPYNKLIDTDSGDNRKKVKVQN